MVWTNLCRPLSKWVSHTETTWVGRIFRFLLNLATKRFFRILPTQMSFKVQLLSSSMGFVSVASTATSLTWLLSSCSSTAAREDAGAVPARWRPFRVFSWRSITATQPSHHRHHQPSLNPTVLDLQEGVHYTNLSNINKWNQGSINLRRGAGKQVETFIPTSQYEWNGTRPIWGSSTRNIEAPFLANQNI